MTDSYAGPPSAPPCPGSILTAGLHENFGEAAGESVCDILKIYPGWFCFLNHSLQLSLAMEKIKIEQREKTGLLFPFQQRGQSHKTYVHVNMRR